jgi:hypothetical protein
MLKNEWWTKQNPEGINNKDVLQVFCAWAIIQSVCICSYLFILHCT